MKSWSIDVIPKSGKYVVRVTENGTTWDKEFNFEQHAHAFADGQYFRLKAIDDNELKVDGLTRRVSGVTRVPISTRDVPVDVYAIGHPEPSPSDDTPAE